MFIRNKTEKSKAVAAKTQANKLPFRHSIVFQTTTIVNAPKSAGKNLIQKSELPNCKMSQEFHDVTGGTE